MSLRRRWVLVAAAVVAVAVAGLAAWAVGRGTPAGSPTATPSGSQCTADDPCLDQPATDGPGTDSPSSDGPGTDEPGTSTPGVDPSADLTEVEMLVTSSGWDSGAQVVWIAGDVPVVESDGTCTATLVQGSDQVEESVQAEPGPRTTTCAVEVDKARLTRGDWLVTLSYSSSHHSATGQKVSINVP